MEHTCLSEYLSAGPRLITPLFKHASLEHLSALEMQHDKALYYFTYLDATPSIGMSPPDGQPQVMGNYGIPVQGKMNFIAMTLTFDLENLTAIPTHMVKICANGRTTH